MLMKRMTSVVAWSLLDIKAPPQLISLINFCEACQLAKQKALHPCSKNSAMIDEKEGNLSENILLPG